MVTILYYTGSSRPNTSSMVTFWMQLLVATPLIFGVVFYQLNPSSSRVFVGGLVMVRISEFGGINGCLEGQALKLFSPDFSYTRILGWVSLSIRRGKAGKKKLFANSSYLLMSKLFWAFCWVLDCLGIVLFGRKLIMATLLSVVHIRWLWNSIILPRMLQHHRIAHTGVFGGSYGDFLSPTKFAISLGGPVVTFSLPKTICSTVKCSQIPYVTSVARLPNPPVICSGLVPKRSWSGVVRNFLAHLGRASFILSLICYGSCWW